MVLGDLPHSDGQSRIPRRTGLRARHDCAEPLATRSTVRARPPRSSQSPPRRLVTVPRSAARDNGVGRRDRSENETPRGHATPTSGAVGAMSTGPRRSIGSAQLQPNSTSGATFASATGDTSTAVRSVNPCAHSDSISRDDPAPASITASDDVTPAKPKEPHRLGRFGFEPAHLKVVDPQVNPIPITLSVLYVIDHGTALLG
jgi:hypothetical protein